VLRNENVPDKALIGEVEWTPKISPGEAWRSDYTSIACFGVFGVCFGPNLNLNGLNSGSN